ncbi:hypothetical protein GUJ93_ZPchr0006g42552 [Zizania palustris]|uniref:Uncharacterized protein n=1 Tax=Zizania palustris TaxID=103762 RepID=A0A8J5VN23_ZIZPA|nr:hypothetical protein GUJ93_ZPchr0006g42552 [Zizania palustris]
MMLRLSTAVLRPAVAMLRHLLSSSYHAAPPQSFLPPFHLKGIYPEIRPPAASLFHPLPYLIPYSFLLISKLGDSLSSPYPLRLPFSWPAPSAASASGCYSAAASSFIESPLWLLRLLPCLSCRSGSSSRPHPAPATYPDPSSSLSCSERRRLSCHSERRRLLPQPAPSAVAFSSSPHRVPPPLDYL